MNKKIFNKLENISKNKTINVKDDTNEDWSHLEEEIQKGLDSGKSLKSHEEIIKNLRIKPLKI